MQRCGKTQEPTVELSRNSASWHESPLLNNVPTCRSQCRRRRKLTQRECSDSSNDDQCHGDDRGQTRGSNRSTMGPSSKKPEGEETRSNEEDGNDSSSSIRSSSDLPSSHSGDSDNDDNIHDDSTYRRRRGSHNNSPTQDSFSLGVEPIPQLPRERRIHKRRKIKYRRRLVPPRGDEAEESQSSINCIRLPYTEVIRSASDFLQELFVALADHNKHFSRHSKQPANLYGTPGIAATLQRPPYDHSQHHQRSIQVSTGDSDPYTGDWMTSQDLVPRTAASSSVVSPGGLTTHSAIFQNRDVDLSLFDDISEPPHPRFITVFASPDPDSACAVSLLKVCLHSSKKRFSTSSFSRSFLRSHRSVLFFLGQFMFEVFS